MVLVGGVALGAFGVRRARPILARISRQVRVGARRRALAAATLPIRPPAAIRLSGSATRLTLAVIGDFGRCSENAMECEGERAVARLVASWAPDYVITTGDNNYPRGEALTFGPNLDPYRRFIEEGRFLPALGNHDWGEGWPRAHLEGCRPPGNGRYYRWDLGPVALWVLDSDEREPDGIAVDSEQASWLREGLESSTKPLNFVVLHHPPYSSGHHGSSEGLRWPFGAWGVDAAFSGHEHSYERLEIGGVQYFVNGSGGAGLRGFRRPMPGSRSRYCAEYGAQRITLDGERALVEFWNARGELVDRVELAARRSAELALAAS